jgi:hypothetical protein
MTISSSARSYSKNIHLVGLLLLCFLLLAAILQWRRRSSETQIYILGDGQKTLMKLSALRHIQLKDARTWNSTYIPNISKGHLRLLVFLTAADCSSCLAELPQWQLLTQSTPMKNLDVSLIFVFASRNEVASFLTAYRLPYQAFIDENNDVSHSVGIPLKTPVSILVDDDYRVLLAQPATNDLSAQREFIDRVGALVSTRGN